MFGENVEVTGNDKANTIIIRNGAAEARGGIGNDIFSVEGGNVIISDFGIGATTPLQDGDLVKLPAKVNVVQGNKDSILGYSESVYAPGTDTLKINGTITGKNITDGDDESETFSVELSVTYADGTEGTVVLENILRDFKKKSGEYVPKNSTLEKELAELKIFDTSTGNSKAIKWKKIPTGNSDEASGDTAEDLLSDDNFTGNDLSELVDGGGSNGITTDNFEVFGDGEFNFDDTSITFTDSTKK